VSILKAWLVSPEHFHHPYPTAEDQAHLMAQTGIDKKQLKNWFTNARRRIWKPLVRHKLEAEGGGERSASPRSPRSGSEPMEDTAAPGSQGSASPRRAGRRTPPSDGARGSPERVNSSSFLDLLADGGDGASSAPPSLRDARARRAQATTTRARRRAATRRSSTGSGARRP